MELPESTMALKRKHSSSAQVYDSYRSISSTFSTDAAKNHQPVSVVEENEMPLRKRRRLDSFEKPPSLHFCEWSGNSDQDTAAKSAEDQNSLQYSACALDDDGLQKTLSSGLEPKRTSFNIGRKRKRSSHSVQVYDSHQSTSSTSSTDAAENHLPISVGEDNEMPMRKRRRLDSFEKPPALRFCERSGSSDQETAAKYERSAEDQNSLQYSACALVNHGPQEPASSGLEVLPPADQQVQTPPASVHLSPVSPAPNHNNRVDLTTEDDILSRYEIGRKLGEGGFGSVYEGKRLEDDLEVAVKFVQKTPEDMEYINIPGHPTPLPLEVGLLTLVNKGPKVPEIIELLEWQDQPDQYIMVLERPPSCQDLWDFLNNHDGILNEDTARFIMTQATMAAHVCCRRGVFHSDIKLENLLVNTETLEVKLIDFGCGDLLQESAYDVFCGTDEYCPPEYNTDGKYHGKPATVWSLGVLLFVLVCGRFPEPNDLEMIYDGIWSEPGLSNECCQLIRSLLQKNPNQRIDWREIIFHKWFKVTE
ncbi:serine/threonine-protein kinase pim-1-like isoform X1 [Megalobrama amblycephala]|uniref:serine/threonine-protein kinase pim-1-like isoform X1 n=1 Tax=Megalobrama amblycephala TaxID=75352 RepID=UPI0020147898|nr:serine/threonine-protein kinase pim-1-like isoform X1 [Megalobrama amblycephala]